LQEAANQGNKDKSTNAKKVLLEWRGTKQCQNFAFALIIF
jgi:hypothetical protein